MECTKHNITDCIKCKRAKQRANWLAKGDNHQKIKEYHKQWRQNNPDYHKTYNAEWRQNNPDYYKNYNSEWRQNNPDYYRNYSAEWRQNNPEYHKTYNVEWRQNNPNYLTEYHREWRNTPWGKMYQKCAKSISTKIKGIKNGNTKYDYFKLHLESLFKEGMTWDNYGTYWEIDHIKSAVLMAKEGYPMEEINSLCNLQPLIKSENRQKSKMI